MPAFLVQFALWIGRVLFSKLIPAFFRGFWKIINMTWAQVGGFLLRFWNRIWALFVKFMNVLTGGRFRTFFDRVIILAIAFKDFLVGLFKSFIRNGGAGSAASFIGSKPIMLLLGFIAIFFADFLANYFGYSFMSIVVYVIVAIVSTVMAWWLDFVWTLIDFSALISLMEYWSGLPTCFTEVALAAGLGGALSALFATAAACVTITFIQSFIRR